MSLIVKVSLEVINPARNEGDLSANKKLREMYFEVDNAHISECYKILLWSIREQVINSGFKGTNNERRED